MHLVSELWHLHLLKQLPRIDRCCHCGTQKPVCKYACASGPLAVSAGPTCSRSSSCCASAGGKAAGACSTSPPGAPAAAPGSGVTPAGSSRGSPGPGRLRARAGRAAPPPLPPRPPPTMSTCAWHARLIDGEFHTPDTFCACYGRMNDCIGHSTRRRYSSRAPLCTTCEACKVVMTHPSLQTSLAARQPPAYGTQLWLLGRHTCDPSSTGDFH